MGKNVEKVLSCFVIGMLLMSVFPVSVFASKPIPTRIHLQDATFEWHTNQSLIAKLTDENGVPLSGKEVWFYQKTVEGWQELGSGVTNDSGVAEYELYVTMEDGSYYFKATFKGDEKHLPSSDIAEIVVTGDIALAKVLAILCLINLATFALDKVDEYYEEHFSSLAELCRKIREEKKAWEDKRSEGGDHIKFFRDNPEVHEVLKDVIDRIGPYDLEEVIGWGSTLVPTYGIGTVYTICRKTGVISWKSDEDYKEDLKAAEKAYRLGKALYDEGRVEHDADKKAAGRELCIVALDLLYKVADEVEDLDKLAELGLTSGFFDPAADFSIIVVPEKTYYRPGEIAKLEIKVISNKVEGPFWLGVSFKDVSGVTYDVPGDSITPKPNVQIAPGTMKEFTVEWTIPEGALLGPYEIAVNCWKDDTFTDKYTDDFEWEMVFYVPEFHITASPEKIWYQPGEKVVISINVENLGADKNIWFDATLIDPQGNLQYPDITPNPDNVFIASGETKTFTAKWTIPQDAPLGAYSLFINCYKEKPSPGVCPLSYADDFDQKVAFYCYNLDILSPTTFSPVIVGDPSNPIEFNVKVTTGIPIPLDLPGVFSAKINDKPAKVSIISSPIDAVNGIYVLQITPPTQAAEGRYDLNISLDIGHGVTDSDVETDAVIYSTGGNIDVVEVIDRSGSMSGEKIQAAKDSAKLFVDLMRIGDMIGVVSYSSSASVNYGLTKIIPASVPFFSQRDDRWKNDPIIDEEGKVCGTIGNEFNNPIGCAMTSTAMILKYYGVDTDPRELNDWLNKNSGYDKGGYLKWEKVTEYAKEKGVEISWIDNRGTDTWRFQDDQPKHWNKLKEEIDKGYPVIVEVDFNPATPKLQSHWVLVTSFEGGNINDPANYHINDPWDLSFDPNKRLSHYYDSKYDNTFFAMRFYHGKTPSSPTKQNAKNAIDGISAGGSTSIGAGLRAAYNELVNKGDPSHPHSIVLMSDGWQNTPPHPDEVLPDIKSANIRVFTIGLGAGADADLLSRIAHDTGGEYYYSPSSEELGGIYNTIAGVVKAESTVKEVKGNIEHGQTITYPVQIDESIYMATFTLTWATGTLKLELIRPDGSKVNPADPDVFHRKGTTYETYEIRHPMIGEWTMKIIAPSTSSSTKTATSNLINAAVGVITNETNNTMNDNWSTEIDVPARIMSIQKAAQAGISYTATVTATTNLTVHIYTDKDKYSLNEPIKIITTLAKAGIPVTEANVNATIERPDNIKEYLPLYDDGKHGDCAALDGVYANYYTNTNVSGSYTITVHASGTASPEEFTREAKKSVYVSGAPAGEISVAPASWDVGIVHPGEDVISAFTVSSTSTKNETVIVSATDLTDAYGNVIGSENIISMPSTFVVPAGGSCVFYERIYVPETAKAGNYTGSIVLTSTANSVNIPITLQVKKLFETDIPNVELLYADPTVTSISVTKLNLSEINETYKPEECITLQSAYMINSTGAGNFTLRFTNIPNANTIIVYKIDPKSEPPNQWIELNATTTADTVTFTMSVGDPPVVFCSGAAPARVPALTPIGIIALAGLLAIVAVSRIRRKKINL